MKTKKQIVDNWLPRYTGKELNSFGRYILLTNFNNYVDLFAHAEGVEIEGSDKAMPSATSGDITIINFGMGSANAATIMDLLSAIKPEACLFLGKCGGLKKRNKLGDMILPIAAIKGEGASTNYMPAEVPALPAFSLQRAVSHAVREHSLDYWTGTVFTTSRRVWEHDDEFKDYLIKIRATAIDMETSAIFTAGFANQIPTGALLLVSDQPMVPQGVKTDKSDQKITTGYVDKHIQIGIDALNEIKNNGETIRHLRFG
jgi:AMP nucleosidase